ncbi:hypothetical protein [Nocardia sp. NPDC050406]|uniref:hypothetical protein n=1 Tax=Nocardia sp. NPDC050406 TaxID=3364318 RepID=UPI003794BC8F
MIQPYNIAFEGTYFRYRVPVGAPPPGATPAGSELRPSAARRQHRQADREEKLNRLGGWQWLYKFPLLLVYIAFIALLGQALELLMFLLFVVLLAGALVELAVQVIVGMFLLVPRLLGLASSRVDIFTHDGNRLASLTVLHVSGYGRAGQLVTALSDQRRMASWPFDPVRDQQAAMALRHFGAEVVRHDSLWSPLPGQLNTPANYVADYARHRRA